MHHYGTTGRAHPGTLGEYIVRLRRRSPASQRYEVSRDPLAGPSGRDDVTRRCGESGISGLQGGKEGDEVCKD